VIALGLVLAVASAVAINGGYALQHGAASALPPLSLRRPVRSLAALFGNRWWTVGFLAGIAGWGMYVAALALAPLSLVQAAAAGGLRCLRSAVHGSRLRARRRDSGSLRSALSGCRSARIRRRTMGRRRLSRSDGVGGVVAVPARVLPKAAPARRPILYAAGDVGTKPLARRALSCRRCLPATGSRSSACSSRFSATDSHLGTWPSDERPIAAGMPFRRALPGGWRGAAHGAAFALVVGAVALSAQARRGPVRGLTPGPAAGG
jgi:hypothetical protein